jgi:hypothetical protein
MPLSRASTHTSSSRESAASRAATAGSFSTEDRAQGARGVGRRVQSGDPRRQARAASRASSSSGNRWLYDELTRNSEDIVLAATLPELVERMNALNGDGVVQLAAVEDAVTRYDAAIRRGPALPR